ncbi:uncharacterized protein LOC125540021 isoform X2 [Triticum urartu]|uniref:uncharacterized protein LOC125540021 isoform X2 n=1 Tax=Triticum urartu TaxID=4572 RepID=UPI0020441638|nr:uncharacterized protein LOC125540021 isoform X2 [Triticum urartu]
MRRLPDSVPAPPAPSAPARQRLATSSMPASVELIHEARRRRREGWQRVRGLRSVRWPVDAAPARQLEQENHLCSWTASLEEVQQKMKQFFGLSMKKKVGIN